MSKFYAHIRPKQIVGRRLLPGVFGVLVMLSIDGCASSGAAWEDTVEVEGVVSVRGNEPFTELVLQTSDRNYYVLEFDNPDERSRMQQATPATFSVRGPVYRGVWGSRAFAHLRVRAWSAR
jgi:hypothetical protein